MPKVIHSHPVTPGLGSPRTGRRLAAAQPGIVMIQGFLLNLIPRLRNYPQLQCPGSGDSFFLLGKSTLPGSKLALARGLTGLPEFISGFNSFNTFPGIELHRSGFAGKRIPGSTVRFRQKRFNLRFSPAALFLQIRCNQEIFTVGRFRTRRMMLSSGHSELLRWCGRVALKSSKAPTTKVPNTTTTAPSAGCGRRRRRPDRKTPGQWKRTVTNLRKPGGAESRAAP